MSKITAKVKSMDDLKKLFSSGRYKDYGGDFKHIKTCTFFVEDMFELCGDEITIDIEGDTMHGKGWRWIPEWLEDMKSIPEIKKFISIETRQAITAKYLPTTNTKPSRYSIHYGNDRCIKSIHEMDDVPAQYVAQALVQKWMKELELQWEIKSACILADGTYVFVG